MAVPARPDPLARFNGLARLTTLARDNQLFTLALGAGTLLRLLTVPYRSRLVNVASRPFYQVADRILGSAETTV